MNFQAPGDVDKVLFHQSVHKESTYRSGTPLALRNLHKHVFFIKMHVKGYKWTNGNTNVLLLREISCDN